MSNDAAAFEPKTVLDFWFPDDNFWATKEGFFVWIQHRMQGGVDDYICTNLRDLTTAAARGQLDHWAETASGRLALVIALDQFPRSLWRDTPQAYGQDIKANCLILESFKNGHFEPLKPWEKLFYVIALTHCEGPDHLQRFDLVESATETLISEMPEHMADSADLLRAQNATVRANIERFGRHPHRNEILGRVSTPEEEAYIAAGVFPHLPNGQPDMPT